MMKFKKTGIIAAVVLTLASASFSQQQAHYSTSGDRIVDYFDVHAAELRSVLRQLSAYSGVDIIASDAAKATVSVTVSNKSWREVLGIICMVHNLTIVEEANFVYVMTKDEAVKRGLGGEMDIAGGAASEAAQMFSPLVRDVIPLKFTTAAEMAPSISAFLSPRGRLTPIQHTNSLVIVDTEENLKQLRKLIEQIDIQTAQVSISCKIIEVSSGAIQKMGVHWGFIDGSNNLTLGQLEGSAVNPLGDEGIHRITYGMLTPEKFTAALEYLFEDNKAEIVAQPQIMTLNNKEAKIFMGQQIPINKFDEANNTVTEMVSTGTELIVTPYVSGDGKIMLALKPKKESYTMQAAGPVINSQSAETNVLVNNGETVVIAGLTSNEKRETEAGIPFLKSIPILGNLFKRSNKSTDKKDLVIFVTPHIVHSGI